MCIKKKDPNYQSMSIHAFSLRLCLAASLLWSVSLFTMRPVQAAPGDGGLIYLSTGARFLDVAPLSQGVSPGQSLPGTPGGIFWDNGFGVMATTNRVLVGLEYHSLWGQLQQKDQQALRIDGNYALLHVGYLAVTTPRAQIFPYLGIGPGRIGLSSTQSLTGLLGLSQGDRQDIYTAEGLSWLVDLGAGANFVFPISTQESATDLRGTAVGLRAGYLFALGGTQWGANQLPAQGGPAGLNVGGWYLNMTFGFGGFRS
jgi:hypothetical protein